jgi:hypothetical protein
VSVSLNRFGDALALQGNVIAALDADRESLDIVRGLVANDPENTGWQSDLVSNLTSLGFVLLMQGDLQGALVAHRESLDITRTLAAKDPGNTKWLRAMSSSLTNLGNVLGVQGNLANAVVAHRESLHIARELVAKDPGNMQWQTDLVSSLNGLALAGDDPGGRWSEALDILNRLKTENRPPPAQQRQITTIEASLAKLGRTEHSWLMKFHFGEMTTARPIPPPRFPSTTVQQIQGRYDGFNTVNQMPGEHQFSLTFVQSENNITATYQSALGGRGKGTGTIKGNVVDGMSLQSEISKCPGSYAASLVFVDDTVNWTYTGQDCGGPVQGHGTARKTNP